MLETGESQLYYYCKWTVIAFVSFRPGCINLYCHHFILQVCNWFKVTPWLSFNLTVISPGCTSSSFVTKCLGLIAKRLVLEGVKLPLIICLISQFLYFLPSPPELWVCLYLTHINRCFLYADVNEYLKIWKRLNDCFTKYDSDSVAWLKCPRTQEVTFKKWIYF